jgi:predicted nucleic acid-binding protein
MKFVIDSNVFVGGLDPKDIFHGECQHIIDRLLYLDIEALCPTIVLVETVCVIRRRTNDKRVATAVLQNLIKIPSLTWLELSVDAAASACKMGVETGLRGGDSIVLYIAHQYGIPLITKDKEMKAKAPYGVTIVDPSDVRL